jgi:hypothetical protein
MVQHVAKIESAGVHQGIRGLGQDNALRHHTRRRGRMAAHLEGRRMTKRFRPQHELPLFAARRTLRPRWRLRRRQAPARQCLRRCAKRCRSPGWRSPLPPLHAHAVGVRRPIVGQRDPRFPAQGRTDPRNSPRKLLSSPKCLQFVVEEHTAAIFDIARRAKMEKEAFHPLASLFIREVAREQRSRRACGSESWAGVVNSRLRSGQHHNSLSRIC